MISQVISIFEKKDSRLAGEVANALSNYFKASAFEVYPWGSENDRVAVMLVAGDHRQKLFPLFITFVDGFCAGYAATDDDQEGFYEDLQG